jgi:peptidoglycan biosynthesis protein MviN/MurJ (putative lipid II flippase)
MPGDRISAAWLYYTAGSSALTGLKVVVPACYALQDADTPGRIGICAMLLNIARRAALSVATRHGGPALATSAAYAKPATPTMG